MEIFQLCWYEFYELLDPLEWLLFLRSPHKKDDYWDKTHDISKIGNISKRNKNIEMKYKQNLFIEQNSSTIESDVSFLWSHFFQDQNVCRKTFFVGKILCYSKDFAHNFQFLLYITWVMGKSYRQNLAPRFDVSNM